MTGSMRTSLILTASAVALALASGAAAQETESQARARALTQALNGGVAPSTPAAQTPASPTRVQPVTPAPRSTPSRPAQDPAVTRPSVDRTLEDLLGAPDEASAGDPPPVAAASTEGETAPEPIAAALGYYVRGATGCGQVWPGDGDLAFLTATTFTLNFGGCEPGEFEQTGVNSWRERQLCQTELGGDAGAYIVDYEMVEPGVMRRSARLQIDGSVEQDDWRFCETADVPQEARFASPT